MFGTGDPREYMRDPHDWRTMQQLFMARDDVVASMSACDACGADPGEPCRWHCVARPDGSY